MNDIEKEAVACAQVALHTLINSANKYNITPAALGLEMETIFGLHDSNQISSRASEILNSFSGSNIPVEINKIGITINEAAYMLGIGRNLMLDLARVKDFPAIRFKRKIIINKNDLITWFSNNYGKFL